MHRVILNKVNGYVRPGMLLALMGASGAGKTTLLDVLAKRKNIGKSASFIITWRLLHRLFHLTTALVSGNIRIDGRVPDAAYRRMIGYVEQTDLHFAQQTVLEALQYDRLTYPSLAHSTQPDSQPSAASLRALHPRHGKQSSYVYSTC